MSFALSRWSECCTHLWRAGGQDRRHGQQQGRSGGAMEAVSPIKVSQRVCQSNQSVSPKSNVKIHQWMSMTNNENESKYLNFKQMQLFNSTSKPQKRSQSDSLTNYQLMVIAVCLTKWWYIKRLCFVWQSDSNKWWYIKCLFFCLTDWWLDQVMVY